MIPPERPVGADEPTTAAAEAWATYFVRLHPYMYATGDVTAWSALSAPDCDSCDEVAEDAGTWHAEGRRTEGAAVTVENVLTLEVLPGQGFMSTMIMRQDSAVTIGPSGDALASRPASRSASQVAIEWVGHWQVRAVAGQELALDGTEKPEDLTWV